MASSMANADPPEGEPGTLGEVLFAGKAAARTPESDWVGLVRSIAAGDQLALRALYARTNRLVFTMVVRIVGIRETAEEVTLDVFHDVWHRASRYDPAGGPVLGWIMNQARSRAIDRLRHGQRKKRVPDPASGPSATAPPRPDQTLASKEEGGLLRQALKVLTPEERLAIETAFFSELSYREVADRLGEPLGTVKTRIRSGLNKLRQALAGTRSGR